VVWLGSVAAIAGIALLSSHLDDRSPAPTPASSDVALLSAGPSIPSPSGTRLTLEHPAVERSFIVTPGLRISGRPGAGTGSLRVVLEARNGSWIVDELFDPARPFDLTVPLPNPRPNGAMVVNVIAYDETGIPIDQIRRPVFIGRIAGG
jgi:hypothetical protein